MMLNNSTNFNKTNNHLTSFDTKIISLRLGFRRNFLPVTRMKIQIENFFGILISTRLIQKRPSHLEIQVLALDRHENAVG